MTFSTSALENVLLFHYIEKLFECNYSKIASHHFLGVLEGILRGPGLLTSQPRTVLLFLGLGLRLWVLSCLRGGAWALALALDQFSAFPSFCSHCHRLDRHLGKNEGMHERPPRGQGAVPVSRGLSRGPQRW